MGGTGGRLGCTKLASLMRFQCLKAATGFSCCLGSYNGQHKTCLLLEAVERASDDDRGARLGSRRATRISARGKRERDRTRYSRL